MREIKVASCDRCGGPTRFQRPTGGWDKVYCDKCADKNIKEAAEFIGLKNDGKDTV